MKSMTDGGWPILFALVVGRIFVVKHAANEAAMIHDRFVGLDEVPNIRGVAD